MQNPDQGVISMFDMFSEIMPVQVQKTTPAVKGNSKVKDKKAKDKTGCPGNDKKATLKKPLSGYNSDYSKVAIPLPITLYCTFGGGLEIELTEEMYNPSDYLTKEEALKILELYTSSPQPGKKDEKEANDGENTEDGSPTDEDPDNIKGIDSDDMDDTEEEDAEPEEETVVTNAEEVLASDETLTASSENGNSLYEEGKVYVTLETIRVVLQRRYPFFTKERSRLEYDKENNFIVGTIFVGQKGYELSSMEVFCQSLTNAVDGPHNLSVVRGTDGLYRVEKTKIGIFCNRIEGTENEKGDELIKPFFRLVLPKIPIQLLKEIFFLFKELAKDSMDEAMVRILYHKEKGTFGYDVPEQITSIDSVDYFIKDSGGPKSKYITVMAVHSHPIYPAIFSETDDMDEQPTGLYGVIGQIFSSQPQVCIRASCSGAFLYLGLANLFAHDDKHETGGTGQ